MDQGKAFTDQVVEKVKSLGGVEAAAAATSFPFNPAGVVQGPGAMMFQIEGKPWAKGEATQTFDLRLVTPDYFATIRQPILMGRALTMHDEEGPPVVIINETMARHRFLNENPIGRRIHWDDGSGYLPWQEIVGVAGDVREYGLNHAPVDEVYAPNRKGFANRLIVRTKSDPQVLGASIRGSVLQIHPMIAIDRVQTIENAEYESMTSPRVMTALLGLFAALAAFISAGGIAAVMALTVSRRRREIGVRMALGARSGSIVGMVLCHGLLLAIAGTVIGMGGAFLLTQLLSSFLYGTSPTDAGTFLAAPLLFLAVAALASYIPARQVTSIDPLCALRQE
jgi:predicted permease